MSRVDFYVLAQAGEHARHAFACRLAEKAYRLDNTVHIHANNRADAQRLDELLWTFRDGSFVPHHLLGTERADLPSPVTIGHDEQLADGRDLLINLCDDVPSFAEGFEPVSYTHLTLPTKESRGRSRWAP